MPVYGENGLVTGWPSSLTVLMPKWCGFCPWWCIAAGRTIDLTCVFMMWFVAVL